jgi:hypothetical protein
MGGATSNEKGYWDVNSRKIIIASLSGLLLVALGIMPFTAATATAATAAPARAATPARQITVMGVTSSGRIFNMEKPPSWLKPNTLVHPLLSASPDALLQPISPDTLSGNYQICDQYDYCINDTGGGGLGTILQFWTEGTTYNFWNWWYEGTVNGANCTSNCWPFTPGTGINTYYQGSPVWKFAFAPNTKGTGNCISQQLYTGGSSSTGVLANLNTATCACSTCQTLTGSKLQYFVLSNNEADLGTLVAVGATNTYVSTVGPGRVWLGWAAFGEDTKSDLVFQVNDFDLALTWSAYL